jgi:hypothetical protein
MSQYPREVLGNKILEDLYTAVHKAKKKALELKEEIKQLKTEHKEKLDALKLDVDELKKPKGGN